MKKAPKVSIIIPVYNAQNTLKRCVDSVLSQSFKDFELILIDDGSTDGSSNIIDQYALEDNRVIPIHKPNGGVSSARNMGLDKAKGEYVAFIDSDDYVTPTYLEDMVAYDDDIIICGFYNLIPTDENNYNIVLSSLSPKRFINEEVIDFLKEESHIPWIYTPWARLFKREVINDNHLHFDLQMRCGEDSAFNMEATLKSQSLRLISNINYYYVFPISLSKYKIDLPTYKYSIKRLSNIVSIYLTKEELKNRTLCSKRLLYKAYYRHVESLTIWERAHNIVMYISSGMIKNYNPRITRFATLKTLLEIIKLIIPGRKASLTSF